MSGFLELTDDARIHACLSARSIGRLIRSIFPEPGVDAGEYDQKRSSSGAARYAIAQLIALLQRDKSRKFIAQQLFAGWRVSIH